MKLRVTKLCVYVVCFSLSFMNMHSRSPLVRVLLAERSIDSDIVWNISSPQGFTLMISDGKKQSKKIYFKKKIVITRKKHGSQYYLSIDNHPFKKDRLYLIPRTGYVTFEEKTYQGSLLIAQKNNAMFCINCLPIEDYVFSVLRTESWPGWPLEVNKVLAIASRSYVLFMMGDTDINKRLYHIKNTNHHQTYSGVHDNHDLKNAVNQTKGIYLGYNTKPILAMFDCCCGGIIPAHIADINFSDAPYLARDYACTYCKPCKIYSWNAELTLQDFEKALKNALQDTSAIHGFNINKRDKAGLVQEVILKGKPNNTTISGQKMYSLFKEVKSFAFNAYKKGKKIILRGRGYGHHRGLCQWGAREMVRHGWTCNKILEFYYPGAIFMNLT